MTNLRPIFFLTGLLFPLASLVAWQSDPVVISANAAAGYVRPIMPDGKPRPETYVFAQGKFFEGDYAERTMNRITFTDVTRTLAASLIKQNYIPIKDPTTAELLIMVHWGATHTYSDPLRDSSIEGLSSAVADYSASIAANGHGDTGAVNQMLSNLEANKDGVDGAIARNAQLLGYGKALQKERKALSPTTAELTMSEELNEERYFLIVQAFDYQYMKKFHKIRLLWVTRLSVRSPSNNFLEALPALSRSGGDVFGRQVDDLVRVKGAFRTPETHLGDMQVLGTVPDEPAKTDKTDKPAK